MSGLLLTVFVVSLSGTIVGNALPRIISDLAGSPPQYAWIMTATLLTMTATGPIWSKLADRTNKKHLMQMSLAVFAIGSILCGFAPNTEALIILRAVEGVGMGGVGAMVHIALAAMVSPRERGRYVGYVTAVAAAATVGGPLVGGLIIDTPLLGWRACFWAPVPVAVAAMMLLRRTLYLPSSFGRAGVDWLGALVIPAAISVFLAWTTLAGRHFGWLSLSSSAFLGATGVLIAVAVVAERRASDPFLPPALLRQRTMVLVIVASIVVGGVMVAASVFFAQYFQVSRGYSPTGSGLLLLPMVAGVVFGTAASGRLMSRVGRCKPLLLIGTALITVGLALLGTIDRTTSLDLVAGYMVVLGLGLGSSLQNLVIAAQNELVYRDLGAGTSAVLSFQSLGGAAGVAMLGSVLAARVTDVIANAPVGPRGEIVVADAYGDATATIFRFAAITMLIAFVAVLLLRETPLRRTIGDAPGASDDLGCERSTPSGRRVPAYEGGNPAA